MRILVTGSNGLIGGEAVMYFDNLGYEVVGMDNNMRRTFFGAAGDTIWNKDRILARTKNYLPTRMDIRSIRDVQHVFSTLGPFDAVIHCAAQPSHDKAREIPITDFEVNALGTLNLLEQTRLYSPNAVFIFTSTNKVYGDRPNEAHLYETPTRWEYAPHCEQPRGITDEGGVSEELSIDQSTHSLFGVSKAAADLMVQEYAHSFGLKTVVFRGGCLTGPGHSGVELHGFLSYLVKAALKNLHYRVYGYKGKQVRDNIHCHDVITAMEQVILKPRAGEVYNIGGGRQNSVSMIEAIQKVESITGKYLRWEYDETPRIGDHICYISNLRKFQSHYPDWRITKSVDVTLEEISEQQI